MHSQCKWSDNPTDPFYGQRKGKSKTEKNQRKAKDGDSQQRRTRAELKSQPTGNEACRQSGRTDNTSGRPTQRRNPSGTHSQSKTAYLTQRLSTQKGAHDGGNPPYHGTEIYGTNTDFPTIFDSRPKLPDNDTYTDPRMADSTRSPTIKENTAQYSANTTADRTSSDPIWSGATGLTSAINKNYARPSAAGGISTKTIDSRTKELRLGTLNVKNVKANCIYVDKILKNLDFLVIQEHWLYRYEANTLEELFPSHHFLIKCVDDEDPLQPDERRRGYSGIAVGWKKSHNHAIKTLQEGGSRLAAIAIYTASVPICLIGAYMPARGRDNSTNEFSSTCDEIREITLKYSSHKIILIGDLNGSLHREPPNSQDKILMNTLKELDVHLPDTYPVGPTFFHNDGTNNSQIDYILQGTAGLIHSVRIAEHSPLNTSDHTLVEAILMEQLRVGPPPKAKPVTNLHRKPNWKKCDLVKYETEILKAIKTSTLHLQDLSTEEVELALTEANQLMLNAARKSIPHHHDKLKTRGRKIWNEAISRACKAAKSSHWMWKLRGKPTDLNDPANTLRKVKKRELRRAQRQAEAQARNDLYEEIMMASQFDQRLFYKMVNKQRKTTTSHPPFLLVDGQQLCTDEDITKGWRSHFLELATPKEKAHFDQNFSEIVEMEMQLMREQIISQSMTDPLQISSDDVTEAIRGLNSNKSADLQGITAEHIKYGGTALANRLTHLINAILSTGKIPNSLKLGIVTPILKKSKDCTLPGNYRGITVTSTLGKLLECVIHKVITPILDSIQNPLQRGFTKNVSPVNAALLVEESINEAKDKKGPIALATLDAEKAFDVVWHSGLLRKLLHMGIPASSLNVIQQLQTNAASMVRWMGSVSKTFKVSQGIRQGAKLSPLLYKAYVNQALDLLQANGLGAHIGTVFVGCPTVADDIALLAENPLDLQTALHVLFNNSSKDRSTFNSSKSEIVIFNSTKSRKPHIWSLGGNDITESDNSIHLGIHRHNNGSFNVEERIQLGRRTIYALFGAGLHGRSGLNPITCCKLYTTYARPRIIYGLEAIQLKRKDLQSLEKYEVKLLRQLQSLPDRCATTAVYALLGIHPITTEIERNTLNLFMRILHSPASTEHALAIRQLALKDPESHSWFVYVLSLLHKYSLPDAYSLIQDTPSKRSWKRQVDSAIHQYWINCWEKDSQEKSSLKFLQIPRTDKPRAHNIWELSKGSPRDGEKAIVKARIVTGTYTLQSNKHKFNQHLVPPTCRLCNNSPEDRAHFLLDCPKTQSIRDPFITTLVNLFSPHADSKDRSIVSNELLLQSVIDCSHHSVQGMLRHPVESTIAMEKTSRNMIYNLHLARSRILKEMETLDSA